MFKRCRQGYEYTFGILIVDIDCPAEAAVKHGEVESDVGHVGLFPCKLGISQYSLCKSACNISVQDIVGCCEKTLIHIVACGGIIAKGAIGSAQLKLIEP